MKRRSRAGGELTKGPRRKAPEPKRSNARERPYHVSIHPLPDKNRRLRSHGLPARTLGYSANSANVCSKGLPQPKCSASSAARTFDLAKVLNKVLELGARLSKADKGVILRAAGNASYYAAATYRHTPEFIESQKGILFAPGRSGAVGRALSEGKSVQIADVFDDPEYAYREFARRGGFRTILGVPLVRDGSPIGLFVLHRAPVRPFTTSISSWSRPSPIKPSSPSRMRDY